MSVCGQRQAKGFLKIFSVKKSCGTAQSEQNQLRTTGHCHLKGHLFKLRLVKES
jgi:hypothetical protein